MSSLEDIVARLRDAVIVLDAQRRITGWYGAAPRMLGWSADEVIGKPVDERVLVTADAGRRRARARSGHRIGPPLANALLAIGETPASR